MQKWLNWQIIYLNTKWDIHFESRELPTEDKVVQINMGDDNNSKSIFVSKNLSPVEREDL